MSKAMLKPRWKAWENKCIQLAYQEKIQHKVIAAALGRSVTSISKRIKKLGLRFPTKTRGRIKGDKLYLKWKDKISLDFGKMKDILIKYAPLGACLEGQVVLGEGCWTSPQSPPLKNLRQGDFVGRVCQQNSLFSLGGSLDYNSFNNPLPLNVDIIKICKEPFSVSLQYVESWAASEGFHSVKGGLQNHGVSYWKNGQYFSQAQMLMLVNQKRFEKKLQPLTLYETEIKLKNKEPCYQSQHALKYTQSCPTEALRELSGKKIQSDKENNVNKAK
jgi:hypothetical protein